MDLMLNYAPQIWLVLAILFFVIEGCTLQFVSFMFACAAGTMTLLTLVAPMNIGVQLAAFLILSAVFFFSLRKVIKRKVNKRKTPTNSDMLIGKQGVVTSIGGERDMVRGSVDNEDWMLQTASNITLDVGDPFIVESINGASLTVAPIQPENNKEFF